MVCRKCGHELPDEAVYCFMCGVKQVPDKKTRHKRGNGMGNAYQRGKTWTARIVLRYVPVEGAEPPRMKPVWRTKGGFATKRDALNYLDALRNGNARPKNAPQLIEYWETYERGELEGLSKSKRVAYSGAWRKLAALHYRPVDLITVAELRDVVASVASTYYTVRDCKVLLSHLFALAGADGWASKDLPSFIVLPPLEEKERQVFTDMEQAALWHLYEAGDLRAAIPLLMICTGMMPGEMQALKVEHIDLEGHRITGVGLKTKVRKASPVYLPEDVLPVVEDLMAHAQPSGYIWPHSADTWYASYYDALSAAGCRRLEPYCCRHTTATRLAISERLAPQTIRRMMRWSTAKMLDRYAHPDEEDVLSAANAIKKVDTAAPDDDAAADAAK